MTTTAILKPWYVIRCTGQEFATCADWCEWCKEHPDGFAMEEGGFKWNGSSICLNPNTPIDFRADANYYKYTYKIETAKSPCGSWSFGVSCQYGAGGFGFGVPFLPSDRACDKEYPTEKAAIVAALDLIKSRIEEAMRNTPKDRDPEAKDCYPSSSKVQTMLKSIADYREYYAPSQPSLFDFLD